MSYLASLYPKVFFFFLLPEKNINEYELFSTYVKIIEAENLNNALSFKQNY